MFVKANQVIIQKYDKTKQEGIEFGKTGVIINLGIDETSHKRMLNMLETRLKTTIETYQERLKELIVSMTACKPNRSGNHYPYKAYGGMESLTELCVDQQMFPTENPLDGDMTVIGECLVSVEAHIVKTKKGPLAFGLTVTDVWEMKEGKIQLNDPSTCVLLTEKGEKYDTENEKEQGSFDAIRTGVFDGGSGRDTGDRGESGKSDKKPGRRQDKIKAVREEK